MCIALLAPGIALAQAAGRITVPRPGQREFVADRADLIKPEDEQKIRKLCDSLLTAKATPIIVVTIESMAQYGGEGMRIETFAMLLFNEWGIGHAQLNGQSWNTGILVLVSKADRKARIELGAYWRHEQDLLAQQIMSDEMIPRFKRGDISAGIVAGVEGLDRMARGLEVPRTRSTTSNSASSMRRSDAPTPWWQYGLLAVIVVGGILAAVSFARNGSSGWAWIGGAALLGGLGYLLYQLHESSSRHRDNDDWGGGGFTGGSFGGFSGGGGGFSGGGGGFSGGGGATGSW